MKLATVVEILTAAIVLIAPALAVAQEPVTSFEQLRMRLKPGDRVWVTDAKGREVEGRIQRVWADALTVDTDPSTTFPARDVSLIREARPDSLWNGTLIGLGVGGGLASAWCLAAAAADSPSVSAGVECAEGFIVFGGLGTLLGLVIDAAAPGKGLVVYRAPGASGAPGHARLSIAPVITPRTKGVALSFSF
jgi:hypothetical protein